MLPHVDIEKVLFLDIETVPQVYRYDELAESARALWDAKSKRWQSDGQTGRDVYEKAGILAEFGRIVCISVGFLQRVEGGYGLRVKTFCSDLENEVLAAFAALLDGHFNTPGHYLCAHNGKEFDFPYIARRMLINGLRLPNALNMAGRKPWEIRHLDTMELWKFGDYKHYTSLELLAHVFGIPSPKSEISGEDVGRVFWEEGDVQKIVKYCEQDVVAIAQLLLRYTGQPLIDPENITVV